MGSTYEVLMSDFGDMSFSASRVQLMEHDNINKEWQRLLVQRLLKKLYNVWVSKRMTRGLLRFNPQAYTHYKWIGPASESVDPTGDASAHIELIKNGLMSKQRYFTGLGIEWKEEDAQIQREREHEQELGITGINPETEPGAEDVDEPQPVGQDAEEKENADEPTED